MPKVSLNIKGKNFEANLVALELMDIDDILGRGWLSVCKGVIKYAQRLVLLITLLGERIEYEGIQPTPKEYENDLLEGASCEDSKVDCEFSYGTLSIQNLLSWIVCIGVIVYLIDLLQRGLFLYIDI